MISEFKVKKYECASCALVIEGICEDTPGIKKAEVNARTRMLKVEHDESVELSVLVQSLEAEGYPVEILKG